MAYPLAKHSLSSASKRPMVSVEKKSAPSLPKKCPVEKKPFDPFAHLRDRSNLPSEYTRRPQKRPAEMKLESSTMRSTTSVGTKLSVSVEKKSVANSLVKRSSFESKLVEKKSAPSLPKKSPMEKKPFDPFAHLRNTSKLPSDYNKLPQKRSAETKTNSPMMRSMPSVGTKLSLSAEKNSMDNPLVKRSLSAAEKRPMISVEKFAPNLSNKRPMEKKPFDPFAHLRDRSKLPSEYTRLPQKRSAETKTNSPMMRSMPSVETKLSLSAEKQSMAKVKRSFPSFESKSMLSIAKKIMPSLPTKRPAEKKPFDPFAHLRDRSNLPSEYNRLPQKRPHYDRYDDDEYDSEMDDFIDDDDNEDVGKELQQELRKLCRSDQNVWKERERQIDLSKMNARYSEIDAEEKRSYRLARLEDALEEKRGSRVLG